MKPLYAASVLLAAFLVSGLTSNAQKILWNKADTVHNDALGFFIDFDAVNNVYTGSGYFSEASNPIVFIKYDAAGNKQWELPYTISTQSNQLLSGMKTAKSGATYAFGNGDSTYFFTKISQGGSMVWQILSDTTGHAGVELNSITLDDEENIYATGSKGNDIYTAKYDSSGNLIWSQTFSSSGPVGGEAIDLDHDGNVLVEGGGLVDKLIVLKYNNDGNSVWNWNYANSAFTSLLAFIPVVIKHDYHNDINLIGFLQNTHSFSDTDFFFHISSSGNLLWKKNFYGEDELPDFTFDEKNNVYLIENTHHDVSIIKYTSAGIATDSLLFNDTVSELSIRLYNIICKNQHIYAGGNFYPSQFAVKVDTGLHVQWESKCIGPYDYASTYTMTLDNSDDILLQGSSDLILTSNGIRDTTHAPFTTKIEDTTDVVNGVKPVVNDESILVFPNPFSEKVNFDFNLLHATSVQIIIRNAEGKQISTLFDGFLNAGLHNFQWIPEHEPAGIYFYECRSNAFSKTGKILLIK